MFFLFRGTLICAAQRLKQQAKPMKTAALVLLILFFFFFLFYFFWKSDKLIQSLILLFSLLCPCLKKSLYLQRRVAPPTLSFFSLNFIPPLVCQMTRILLASQYKSPLPTTFIWIFEKLFLFFWIRFSFFFFKGDIFIAASQKSGF